ncbi:hypothetical protein [Yoonia sp. BS5-3]|uniref:Uncharacterized protein n=1 Tax=Yoonia phaeophyticola TaxID=3137369 RepID=A0ABZ2VBR3_9RHOB
MMYYKTMGCDFRDILTPAGIAVCHVEIDFDVRQGNQLKRRADDPHKLSKAFEIWNAAKPVSGTAGAAYLHGPGNYVRNCPQPYVGRIIFFKTLCQG